MQADRGFEELRTSRLRLRRSEPRDAERISAYRSDPEVRAHQGWERTDPDHVRGERQQMLDRSPAQRGGWVHFTVDAAEDEQVVREATRRVAQYEPGVVMV